MNRYEYHLVRITEHLWCDYCRLSSAVELHYAITHRLDPTRWLGEQTTRACRDCGITTYHTASR